MRVFLIRHPRPAVANDVCYGATDLELIEDARDCATRLRPRLPTHVPLFSSPLRRCRGLADALHPAPAYDARLREMDFGAWELRNWSQIPRAELDAWAASPMTYVPPGGESVEAVRARVTGFLDERLSKGDEGFVVVSHAGIMRIIVGRLRGLDEATWFNLRFDYGELIVLEGPGTDG